MKVLAALSLSLDVLAAALMTYGQWVNPVIVGAFGVIAVLTVFIEILKNTASSFVFGLCTDHIGWKFSLVLTGALWALVLAGVTTEGTAILMIATFLYNAILMIVAIAKPEGQH